MNAKRPPLTPIVRFKLFMVFVGMVSIPEQITPRNLSKGNQRTGQRETVLSND